MKIIIEFIPHKNHRYDTVGDWWWEGDVLQIRASIMSSVLRSFLVTFHEVFEAMWCLRNGVTQKAVDRFDKNYEKHRREDNENEPGDDPSAPYYTGHQFATAIERMACAALRESWVEYEREIEQL